MDDESQFYELLRYKKNIESHIAYVCSNVQSFHAEMLVQILCAEDILTPGFYEKFSETNESQRSKELFYHLVSLPTPIWCQPVLQTMRQMELNDVVDVVEGIKQCPSVAQQEIPQSVQINPLFDEMQVENPPEVILQEEIVDVAGTSGLPNSAVNNESIVGEVMKLRNYQLELSEPALKGINCVIVAPTGTGKTFVALHICLKHLAAKPDGKVIFLVHKVPLVQQQFALFRKFVAPKGFSVQQISGSTIDTPSVAVIKRTQVLVMTHQILLNALREKNGTKMTEISLIIFDECHNVTKNHPYNDIMRVYLKQKSEGVDWVLPQIVGLTASPGSGKSRDEEQASKHVFQLLANLDVTLAPVQVKRNIPELQHYTTQDNFETIPVDRDPHKEFAKKIVCVMERIENRVKELIERNENVLIGKVDFNVSGKRGRPEYENGVISFRNDSVLIEDAKLSQNLQIYAKHLQIYNNALLINEHVRELDAIYYIEENLFQTSHELEEKLKQLYELSGISEIATISPSPLLQKLIEIIERHFSDLPDSRCIVFARTRDVAKLLVECIKGTESLSRLNLNPDYLTGAGAKKSEGGLTKVTQDERLKLFREGKHKIIIATSIADEGIDIKECNLVITYNHCSNEIALVQRKGRGRAKDSKMFILAYSDRGFIQKEEINQDRNSLTNRTLAYIDCMDAEEVAKKILEIQSKAFTVSPIAPKTKQTDDKVWELLCKHCKKHVTTSDQIRKINQHFVTVDKDFPSLCYMPDMKALSVKSEVIISGKLHCSDETCRQEWGSRMIYKEMEVYVLSIKNFVLKNDEASIYRKQWKGVPFSVDKNFDDDFEEQGSDEGDDDIYAFSFDD